MIKKRLTFICFIPLALIFGTFIGVTEALQDLYKTFWRSEVEDG